MTRALVAMTCVMAAVIGITLWLHTIVTPADVMIGYAQDAVEYTRQHHRIELDYSEESIAKVEELIAGMRQLPGEKREIYIKMWGGYFGEMIRRQHGGRWTQISGAYVLDVKGSSVSPNESVRRSLMDGSSNALNEDYVKLLQHWSR